LFERLYYIGAGIVANSGDYLMSDKTVEIVCLSCMGLIAATVWFAFFAVGRVLLMQMAGL
jgi:hypothetical protein